MGTEYWIADTKNRRRFGVGKGSWHKYTTTRWDLATRRWIEEAFDDAVGGVYKWFDVAERVFVFCEVAGGQVEIRSEHNEEGDWQSWPEVDDRYANCASVTHDPDPCAEQTAAALERARGMR